MLKISQSLIRSKWAMARLGWTPALKKRNMAPLCLQQVPLASDLSLVMQNSKNKGSLGRRQIGSWVITSIATYRKKCWKWFIVNYQPSGTHWILDTLPLFCINLPTIFHDQWLYLHFIDKETVSGLWNNLARFTWLACGGSQISILFSQIQMVMLPSLQKENQMFSRGPFLGGDSSQ